MQSSLEASLERVVQTMEALAPPSLAEPWDNTGLLLQAHTRPITTLLLTIDLSPAVLAEAAALGAEMIVAYHPPIFDPLQSLVRSDHTGRIVLDAISHGISLYSPHTALDAVQDGVTDWLARGLGPLKTSLAIRPSDPTAPNVGAGRIVSLAETTSLHTVMMRVKAHLGLEQMRVATPEHEDPETLQVTSVAVCPGAGGSLFEEVGEVDLFLTGEMRHHDVLHKTETGASVLLAEHTNSERGYLPILAQGLTQKLPSDCAIHISSRDRDPIQIR